MSQPVPLLDRITFLANERIERTWRDNGWTEPPLLSAGIVQAVLSAYYDARYSFLQPAGVPSGDATEAKP